MKTTTIVAATVGMLAVATVGYAVYFDSKRQSDPEFKRKLSTFDAYRRLHSLLSIGTREASIVHAGVLFAYVLPQLFPMSRKVDKHNTTQIERILMTKLTYSCIK